MVPNEMVTQKCAFFSADLATNRIEQFYFNLTVIDPSVFQRAFPTPERPDAIDAGKEIRPTALYGRDIQRLPPAIQLFDFGENCALLLGQGHGRQHHICARRKSDTVPICLAYLSGASMGAMGPALHWRGEPGVCESCMTSVCAKNKETRPAFGTPGASWSRHSCYDFVGVVSNFVSTR